MCPCDAKHGRCARLDGFDVDVKLGQVDCRHFAVDCFDGTAHTFDEAVIEHGSSARLRGLFLRGSANHLCHRLGCHRNDDEECDDRPTECGCERRSRQVGDFLCFLRDILACACDGRRRARPAKKGKSSEI